MFTLRVPSLKLAISLIARDNLTLPVVFLNREYGTIDDVDIDLHINISFLDVSHHYFNGENLRLLF